MSCINVIGILSFEVLSVDIVSQKNLTLAGGTTGLSEVRTLLERQTDGVHVT